MNRQHLLSALCVLALAAPALADGVHILPYGAAATIDFPLFAADGTLSTSETDGGTDVTLTCDEGTGATATNDFVDEGSFYSIALTATEMQCARLVVEIAGSAVTTLERIETYGNASAANVAFDANVTQISGDSTAADNLESAADGTGYNLGGGSVVAASVTGDVGGDVTGSVGSIGSGGITEASFATTAGSMKPLGIVDQGTAQSATSTTLVMRSAAALGDDTAIGMTLVACGSTQGYCQSRAVSDNVGSTDTLTVDTWSVTPSGTITYYLFGTAPGNAGDAPTASENATAVWSAASRTLTALDEDDTTIDINGTAVGAAASVTGAVGSVTGNVGGNVTGTIGGLSTQAKADVNAEVDTALSDYDAPTNAELTSGLAGLNDLDTAGVQTAIGVLTGTCDSGSTTTCVDDALTQANASQLEDRLICFEDDFCALITTFAPSTDTVTTTKTAPATRASLDYTIYPATAE